MVRTLTSAFAIGVAARITAQVSSFALILVASRALDLAEFGSYAIASALMVITTTLVYTGIFHLILRTDDLDRDRDTFFLMQLAIGLTGAAIMAVTGLALGGPAAGGTALALVALAPNPALAALSAWMEAQLVRQSRIRTTALATLLAELVALATSVAMFQAGYKLEALISGRYTSMAFILLVYLAFLRRLPRLSFRRDSARHGLQQAWPLWGSTSLGMLSNYGADLVLGAFLSPAAVGAYRAGSRVANTAADVVLQPLGTISWARFARLESATHRPDIRAAWQENLALCAAILAPAMLSVCLLAPGIVSVLLDPSWGAAAGVVAILAMARSIDSLTFLLEPTMTCLGKGRLQFLVRLCDATLLVALLLALGRSSAEAAALAILAKSVVMGIVATWVMARALALKPADLAETLAPGIGLALVCLSVILTVRAMPIEISQAHALFATAGAVIVTWALAVAGLMRRRWLVLPTP
ncbi:MAG: translocase [Rhodobacteraceae bacterium]|nr:translocase [Paracoccaceae bacterium]